MNFIVKKASFLFAILILLAVFSSTAIYAQAPPPPSNDNHVFQNNIGTVQFFLSEYVLSEPVVILNSGAYLFLSFDDLDNDIKDYVYTITRYNADWKATDLEELEYLDGFNGERIEDYEYSSFTKTPYTNYRLQIPNEDIRWTKSGNYVLAVFEDNDEFTPVLTRRFVVAEQGFKVNHQFKRPSKVNQIRTHHEIQFEIGHEGIRINNPEREVKVRIIQNWVWNDRFKDLKPRPFSRKESILQYDFPGKVTFPAINEYRQLDIRSLRSGSNRVNNIENYTDGFEAFLHVDKKRGYLPYIYEIDTNGRFVIENSDRSNRFVRSNPDTTSRNDFRGFDALADAHNLEGDYALVNFTLDSPTELYGSKVYVFGAFTDWKTQEQFELKYDLEKHQYVGEAFLKQGYYTYLYAVVPDNQPKKIDFTPIEGSWHETENEYTILVYYRPFGARYDRVMAAKTFSTHR